jgi:hypothetical protein
MWCLVLSQAARHVSARRYYTRYYTDSALQATSGGAEPCSGAATLGEPGLHHTDLGTGYGPADCATQLAVRDLPELMRPGAAREDAVRVGTAPCGVISLIKPASLAVSGSIDSRPAGG